MPLRRATALRSAAASLVVVVTAGCSAWSADSGTVLGLVTPYRIPVQQGNVVTQEQVARLKPGMNRLQVRDALGTPLLTDTFHADRWDYIFTLRQPGMPMQRRNVVLIFEGDVLKNIDAPDLPTEREFLDSIARSGRLVAASELELSPEQLKSLPVPPRASAPAVDAAASAPAAPPRQYPPLEPS